MEKTKKSIKRRMDTEELVWVHMEYQSRKENETVQFAEPWMSLEAITPPGVSEKAKDTYPIISLLRVT